MGIRALIATAILLAAGTSEAGHKLFMLRANSTSDWGTRTHVEKTVVGLARNVDRGVARGDMSFADLATSIGCTKDLDGCKNGLLDALVIDELVVVTIDPAGDDKVKVTVQRATRKGIRAATGIVDKADPVDGLIAAIGPLFGAKKLVGERPAPSPPPAKPGSPPSGKGTMTLGTAQVDNEQPPGLKTQLEPTKVAVEPKPAPEPAKVEPKPEPPKPEPPKPEPPKAEPPPSAPVATVTAAPDNVVRADVEPDSRRPLYVGGMVAGGVTAIVGVVLWEKAHGIEADARAAPNKSAADITALRDLESSGDHYALAGNLAFVGGLALAGVSGYLFWRSGDAHVAPMAVDHGGGVALTFGAP